MFGILKNNKGITFVEVAASMAVIAIISIPLMMSFDNSIVVSRKTEAQIRINELLRVAKENVTESVKTQGTLLGSSPAVSLYDGTSLATATGVSIVTSRNDVIDTNYTYDAVPEIVFGGLTINSVTYPNTCQYRIVLSRNGTSVKTVLININRLGDIT